MQIEVLQVGEAAGSKQVESQSVAGVKVTAKCSLLLVNIASRMPAAAASWLDAGKPIFLALLLDCLLLVPGGSISTFQGGHTSERVVEDLALRW